MLIGFANPPEEMYWVGVAEILVQRFQDVGFGLKELCFGVRGIGRGCDLFRHDGDERTGNPDELQLDEGDDASGMETIYDIDTGMGIWGVCGTASGLE